MSGIQAADHQDPLTFLNNPAQGNRYTYAGDNPINNIDPTGNNLFSAIDSIVEGTSQAIFGFGLAGLVGGGTIEVGATAGVIAGVAVGAGLGIIGVGLIGLGAYELATN